MLFSPIFTLTVILVFSLSASSMVFADVISPYEQLDLNFTPKEVVCKESLVKITRDDSSQVACVSPETAVLLVDRGFAEVSNPNEISEIIEQQPTPVGKITHMATTKHYTNPGQVESFPKIVDYNYVFKICAFEEKIKFPTVVVTSDSETKSIKLPRQISAEQCNTSAVKVKASDPDSISSRLLNHGGVTEVITELESKIESLKSDITTQREKLPSINDEVPGNDRAKKVSAIHKKITDIRNELKNTRVELNKYSLLLSLSDIDNITPVIKGKSITGVPIEGVVSEIVSVNEALIQPEDKPENSMACNVVFEICTDSTLRIPIVELTSDVSNKIVKMAEKITGNSCQVSTGKINSQNPNSISIKLAGQTQSSETIISLEKQIGTVKELIQVEQEKLNFASTSSSISKEDRSIAISELTMKSQELRKELNSLKVELHKILLEIYR